MAAPICTYVREILETMRYTVIDLLFVWVGLIIRLADAFCDYLGVAFGVAGVFAVLTLHAGRVFEQFSTESTTHDIVELLLDEFVALLFVNLFFLLSYSTLPIKTDVERTALTSLLLEAH